MLIVCPNCTTPYEIDPLAVGESGRSVRCIRCKNVWFAGPPGSTQVLRAPKPAENSLATADEKEVAAFRDALGTGAPSLTPEEPPAGTAMATNGPGGLIEPPAGQIVVDSDETAHGITPDAPAASPGAEPSVRMTADPTMAAAAEIHVPAEHAPPLAPTGDGNPPGAAGASTAQEGPEDIESVARRRAKHHVPHRSTKRTNWLPATILALVALCAALLGWRKDIVRHVPQMASFYASIGLSVNLRGLAFTDVTLHSETHDNVPILVVEGTIVNTTSKAVDVPRLRFALRNTAGAEVYTWTAVPSQSALPPGGTLPFRSRLASPPRDGQRLQVRFFTQRDVQSGTH